MITFASAVKRGAPNTFTVAALPFGSYATTQMAVENAVTLSRKSKAEALKLEGGSNFKCEIIKRLTDNGIAVMGHLGLTPQSVHEQGGYYTHGKNSKSYQEILTQAKNLEAAGCFAIVLECVTKDLAKEVTQSLSVPTIGIGSGQDVDGQVLVINDLLKLGPDMPPSFCMPVTDLYQYKKELIESYLNRGTPSSKNDSVISDKH
jgi:3-methyl-2-oxobutanoate hydroxymethyltransferase